MMQVQHQLQSSPFHPNKLVPNDLALPPRRRRRIINLP
jgi:hypothetical protein